MNYPENMHNPSSDFDHLSLQEVAIFEANYISPGSAAYEAIRQARIAHGATRVYPIKLANEQLTLVAAINPGPDGSGLDGHDHDPTSRNMVAVNSAMVHYLANTPPENQYLIYEGDPLRLDKYMRNGAYDDKTILHKAIADRSESGLVQLLAAGHVLPMESGEPADETVAQKLLQQFSVEQVLAHRVMRGLTFELRTAAKDTREPALWNVISLQAAKLGIGEFRELDESEKQSYMHDTERMHREIITPTFSYVEGINRATGKSILAVNGSGVVLTETYVHMDTDELYHAIRRDVWGIEVTDRQPLTAVNEAEMILRDKSIYAKIIRATLRSKSPIVVYGGSHIESLLQVFKSLESK
jgi:hypothetical protein